MGISAKKRMDDEIRDTIEKYTKLFRVFVDSMETIPMNSRSKKEYTLPHGTLLKYSVKGASGISKTNKEAFCKFVKNNVTEYLTILEREIVDFDMKFVMLLDRFQKSKYYNPSDIHKHCKSGTQHDKSNISTLSNANTSNASYAMERLLLGLSVSSKTRSLPWSIRYHLKSDQYKYLSDYKIPENQMWLFIIGLLRGVNQTQTDTTKEWQIVKQYIPDELSNPEELEIAIKIHDKIQKKQFIVFNNEYILNLITQAIPFLNNGLSKDIHTILKLEQFETFYRMIPELDEILDLPDLENIYRLSCVLTNMGIKCPDNVAMKMYTFSDIPFVQAYSQLSKEIRLLIKAFFPYKNGIVFIKDTDTDIQPCKTFEEIKDRLKITFCRVDDKPDELDEMDKLNKLNKLEPPNLIILLFSDYYVIKSDKSFFQTDKFTLNPNPKFVTFKEYLSGLSGLSGLSDWSHHSVNSPILDDAYREYRDKYMIGYYVPETYESALFGYLNEQLLLYGVEETDKDFVVFKRFMIPKEPLKDQYRKVYNLVRQKPPVPTINRKLFDLLEQGYTHTLRDLYNVWMTCAKNAVFTNLIQRTDGYQTTEGYYCREVDVWKSDIYYQGNVKDWDLKRTPYLSIHQIQHSGLTPKDVCLLSCLTSHWNYTSVDALSESVFNTDVPTEIDVLTDQNLKPKCTRINNVSPIQLLPFILKFGPVVRHTYSTCNASDTHNTNITKSAEVTNDSDVSADVFDADFYAKTLYYLVKWNLGKLSLEELKAKFGELFVDGVQYVYSVKDSDVGFLHTESTLSSHNHQFPPLPCYVNVFGKQGRSVLYAYDEITNEYTIRNGESVEIVTRDHFEFDSCSRILPYPVTFLKNAYTPTDWCPQPLVPNDVNSGVAIENIGGDRYIVTVGQVERKMTYRAHFIWDDQTYIDQNTKSIGDDEKVYLKDISIDDYGNVTDAYNDMEEPYRVPRKEDRSNNRPYYDLYFPSSRFCILPFLNFIGVKKFVKADQDNLINKVMLKKKCIDSSCLLVKCAVTVWLDCIEGTRKWDKTQLYDSLGEFLDKEQMNLINLDTPEDNYPVLNLILDKLYESIHWHHSFRELWDDTCGAPKFTKELKLIPKTDEYVTDFTSVVNGMSGAANAVVSGFPIFQEYPDAIKLYNCFIEGTPVCREVLDIFWHGDKWYKRTMNTTEATKFRDHAWKKLLMVPKLVSDLPMVQQQKLSDQLKLKNVSDIYSSDDPKVLLKVVKFLDSLSMFLQTK